MWLIPLISLVILFKRYIPDLQILKYTFTKDQHLEKPTVDIFTNSRKQILDKVTCSWHQGVDAALKSFSPPSQATMGNLKTFINKAEV